MTSRAQTWEASRSRRMQAAAIPAIVTPAMRALGRTWRCVTTGWEQFDALMQAGRPPIIACWHEVILPSTVIWRDRGIVVLASQNFDGEWISRIVMRFGYEVVRGSSSRGGSRALAVMARALRGGKPVAFTMDGPRGPARQAQPGALWLARHSGHPILPFHIAASPAWRLGSWDRGLVPKPRSRVVMVVGTPFVVDRDTDDEALGEQATVLDRAMRDVERRAEAALANQT